MKVIDGSNTEAEPLLLSVTGGIGCIVLDRPSRLNALTPFMFRRITAALRRWCDDRDVRAVMITGAGGRAFSAGGDLGVLGTVDPDRAQDYWSEQYVLDLTIRAFPKPFVSIVDGIAMGSGLGLAMHGTVRVVTERAVVAMPEVRIGLAPDAGSTMLFAAAPGRLGEFLAATGASIGAGDTIECGLADVFVPHGQVDELERRLGGSERIDSALAGVAESPPRSALRDARARIDAAFALPTVEAARRRLSSDPDEGGSLPAAGMGTDASPTAAEVAVRLVRAARERDGVPEDLVRAALLAELRANSGLFVRTDRAEGVRARIGDRSRPPAWRPSVLSEEDPAEVDDILRTAVPAEWVARIS